VTTPARRTPLPSGGETVTMTPLGLATGPGMAGKLILTR
jgi:hypothetical protein